MSEKDFDAENGNRQMYAMEQNNNTTYKYHDPWTRGNAKEKEAHETPLVGDNGDYAGGKIYKPGRQSSSASEAPLTGVAKRKASVYHQEPHPGTASFAISVFNLMNAVLGSGILGLPYAMAQLGIVLFFIFEVIVSFLALYAIHLLLKMCDHTNVKAYEKLGFIAFGLPGRIIAAVCILMQNIGAMSSYLFIVKYELPNVIMTLAGDTASDGSWYYNGDILVVIVTCVIIMPLASLRNIGFLGYTSGFSISCMLFFTGVLQFLLVTKFNQISMTVKASTRKETPSSPPSVTDRHKNRDPFPSNMMDNQRHVIVKKFQIECPLFDRALFESPNATMHHGNVTGDDGGAPVTQIAEVLAAEATKALEQLNETMAIVFENATSFVTGYELGNMNDTHHGIERELTPIQKEAFELYHEFGPQQCEAAIFGLTNKWAYSIPTMMFSFVCHTAVLPIYAELKKPCAARMQKVSNTSISICFILYSLSALFGYLTFYNWVEPELLLMYSYVDQTDVLTLVVRLCVLFAVVLTVPLTHFPARKAITFLLFPNKDFSWIRHICIMLGLLTFINVLVVFVPTIREVFGIIGATASTMLVFVLPSIFFLRIDDKPLKKSREKIGALLLFCLGIIVMVQSLTVIIIGYAS